MVNKYSVLFFWLVLALGSASVLQAQVLGGRYAHAWLRAPNSPQLAGLGGWQLRIDSRDPAMAGYTPAALSEQAHRVVHLSQDFMNAGIGRSVLAGAYHLDKYDADVSVQMQYVGYGEFQGRDERGQATNAFNANEYGVGFAFAKTLNARIRAGAQVQMLGGSIEDFNSMGAAFSGGLMYVPDTVGRVVYGIQFRNAGYLWNNYSDTRDNLPAELSIGLTRRLRYLPLRFGLLYRYLNRWDLLYDDPDRRESTNFFGEGPTDRSDVALFIDNFTRHLAANAEFYLGKNDLIQLRIGYDHQRQREMKVNQFRSLAGFSYGVGFNFRRFRFDYGHSIQHVHGGSHQLGILLDLGV